MDNSFIDQGKSDALNTFQGMKNLKKKILPQYTKKVEK